MNSCRNAMAITRHGRPGLVLSAQATQIPQTTPNTDKPRPEVDRNATILVRPEDAAFRREFGTGKWIQRSTKISLGQTNVMSLVERVSRSIVVLKNPSTSIAVGRLRSVPDLLQPSAARGKAPVLEVVAWTGRSSR